MTPHERFVHFVVLFLGSKGEAFPGRLYVEEAVKLGSVDDGGPPHDVHVFPMKAAWDYVQFRNHLVSRPAWLPPDRVLARK